MNLFPVLQRFIPFLSSNSSKATPKAKVIIQPLLAEPVAEIDPCYLSFSIDISVLAGGFWWEGSQAIHKGLGALRIPPLKLRGAKLDTLVQALGTSYLRIGGSEADKIHYFTNEQSSNKQNGSEEIDSDSLILTRKIWDDLHAFLARNELKLYFTFKYGLFKRDQHGRWQSDEVEKFLAYTQEKNYVIDVCELGNELNAYWAFHGITSQPRAKKLAHDYSTFVRMIRTTLPACKIAGPGSAFWPRLGETIKPFSNITKTFLEHLSVELDIVDWHYYPFQSTRSPIRTRTAKLDALLQAKNLNDYTKYAKQLSQWRDQFQPNALLWTGETGSAQCGGQEKVSDRFASCFWWLDQLGQGALLGQKVMVRQSLIGGEYGLIERITLRPKPDYWASWLWVRLMAEKVYAIQSSDPSLRIYCHSAVNIPEYKKTLLVLNLSAESKVVSFVDLDEVIAMYQITAKKLTSKKIYINGVRPKLKKGKLNLADFPAKTFNNEIAPYSISFLCLN